MKLRVLGRGFEFHPVSAVIALAALLNLLGLGAWQVQRLAWKENLIATIDARINEPPVDVATLPPGPDADYRPASAAGVFLNDKSLFLTAISLTGAGGYHVLTPLKLADGRYLLVDRGWIPYDRRDGKYFKPEGEEKVSGLVRLPPPPSWIVPANDAFRGEWHSYDLTAMARATGVPEFLPFVLAADITPNPGDYPVGGQTRVTLPNNHLVYAITWFSMAIALVVICVMRSRSKK